jgi:hypothetical protein
LYFGSFTSTDQGAEDFEHLSPAAVIYTKQLLKRSLPDFDSVNARECLGGVHLFGSGVPQQSMDAISESTTLLPLGSFMTSETHREQDAKTQAVKEARIYASSVSMYIRPHNFVFERVVLQ